MDTAEFYFSNILGHYPDNEEDAQATRCTLRYLEDCGLQQGEILSALIHDDIIEDKLTPDKLPKTLWENSLIEQDHFYYHHALRLTSPPPSINSKSSPFYLEMKIRFTMTDLIDYFYKELYLDSILRDDRRDSSQFNTILKQFKRFLPIEPLDMTLSLIDYAKHTQAYVYEPFDIKNGKAIAETHEKLKQNMSQAKLAKADQVVWRSI